MAENQKVWQQLLGNPHSRVEVFEGANHLMLLGETRGDFQYTEIEGYPEGLFMTIHHWIGERCGLAGEYFLASYP